MAIRIVEEKSCDWCGGDDPDGLKTHRLVWDKRAVEVEIHDGCIEEANITWLIEHGRKATAAEVKAASNGVNQLRCPECSKPCSGSMGLAQHLAGSHPHLSKDVRQQLVQDAKMPVQA